MLQVQIRDVEFGNLRKLTSNLKAEIITGPLAEAEEVRRRIQFRVNDTVHLSK